MKKALIPLANGCEEMEAVIITDTLRRANIHAVLAGLQPGIITASRGVGLAPDTVWDEINPADFDIIILPGGMDGSRALAEHAGVQQALKDFDAAGKTIAAICAAPLALFKAGLLNNRKFTCYPGIEHMMNHTIKRETRAVVQDGNLITSQGPGTAFEFALTLVEYLTDTATARRVREGMLL